MIDTECKRKRKKKGLLIVSGRPAGGGRDDYGGCAVSSDE